jgi:hypothetical protein
MLFINLRIFQSAEAYIPYMYGLVVAIEGNPNLRLNVPLCKISSAFSDLTFISTAFSWTSCFSAKNKDFFICYTYRFEVIMTLFVSALPLSILKTAILIHFFFYRSMLLHISTNLMKFFTTPTTVALMKLQKRPQPFLKQQEAFLNSFNLLKCLVGLIFQFKDH